MEFKLKLKPPTMPNFISFEMPPRARQEGIKTAGISVDELSKEQAEEYGELMKQTFIKHWKNKTLPNL